MTRYLRRALAGLQTGVTGSLAMLAWLVLGSLWYRRSLWWIPNLFGSTFFGERALRPGFGMHTLAGVALHVALYGSIGVLFGLAVRDARPSLRLFLLAMLTAVAGYYLLYREFGKSINPWIALYGPDRQLLIAHLLYGAFLSRFPRVNQAIGGPV